MGAFQLASLHAFLGDEPTALEWLERACVENAPELVFLRVEVEPICPMAIPASRLSAAHRAAFVERLGRNRA